MNFCPEFDCFFIFFGMLYGIINLADNMTVEVMGGPTSALVEQGPKFPSLFQPMLQIKIETKTMEHFF